VFYGKIINRTGGQEYVLNTGTLTWVISRADGQQINLSASLLPLKNGAYSYRLLCPRSDGVRIDGFDQFRSAHSAIGEVQQFANQS